MQADLSFTAPDTDFAAQFGLEFEVSRAVLEAIATETCRVKFISPRVMPAVKSDFTELGNRQGQLLTTFVGSELDTIQGKLEKLFRVLGHTDGFRLPNLTELIAFAMAFPDMLKGGLIFTPSAYHLEIPLDMAGSSSKMEYGYPYLNFGATEQDAASRDAGVGENAARPYAAMWYAGTKVPAHGRVLILRK